MSLGHNLLDDPALRSLEHRVGIMLENMNGSTKGLAEHPSFKKGVYLRTVLSQGSSEWIKVSGIGPSDRLAVKQMLSYWRRIGQISELRRDETEDAIYRSIWRAKCEELQNSRCFDLEPELHLRPYLAGCRMLCPKHNVPMNMLWDKSQPNMLVCKFNKEHPHLVEMPEPDPANGRAHEGWLSHQIARP